MAVKIMNPSLRSCPVKGVLFDLDGVILDSEKLYTRFWMEAAGALGFTMSRPQALGLRSLNHDTAAERLHEYFGPEADYDRFHAKRIELMNIFVDEHGMEAKPGICELLDALEERKIPAVITTSSPPDRVFRYLEPLGLQSRFFHICTATEVAHGKPEPDIYLLGAKVLDLPPCSCIAIEDSDTGILSAFRAGCMPIMVPDQSQPAPEALPRLYALADSLADIISLLDGE